MCLEVDKQHEISSVSRPRAWLRGGLRSRTAIRWDGRGDIRPGSEPYRGCGRALHELREDMGDRGPTRSGTYLLC